MGPVEKENKVNLGRRTACAALLSAFVAVGAGLMAIALSSPRFWWLGWVTLVPLFWSIRVLSPLRASFCGAFWGLSFYVFSGLLDGSRVPHDLFSFFLLLGIPGLYSFLAAEVTRKKGFHPFLLGLGWAGVELALKPLALRHGLLATTQGNSLFVHAVGNLGGYVLVAFLLALGNAWLFSLLSSVRVSVPRSRPIRVPTHLDILLPILERIVVSTRFLSPVRPRAPPLLIPNR